MSSSQPTILVTGATGLLGQLVVSQLLPTQPLDSIIATGRNLDSLAALRARGIETRLADYARPETLRAAFQGVDRLLLISSNEFGQRASQHRNVIAAARAAQVKVIVYTSILRADTSELELAAEHLETEIALRESGIPFVLLRNGWYTENYASALQQALASGAIAGASAQGRISTATRADFAAAAVAVLTSPTITSGTVYELAGDDAFTMQDFANEISKQTGKPVSYNDMAATDYSELLKGFGLPAPVAHVYAQSDDAASRGALFDNTRKLSALIGRPTTPLSAWIGEALSLQPVG